MKASELPKRILDLNPQLLTQCEPALTFKDVRESNIGKADDLAERELQQLCEQELSRRGIWCLHLSPRAREKAGVPDLIFAVDGVAFGVELKTATGKLSEAQKATLEHMAANRWRTAVVRSFDEFRGLITTGQPTGGSR